MNVQGQRLRDKSSVEVDSLKTSDENDVAAVMRALPERDVLFVGFDVRDEAVILPGVVGTVARRDGKVLGFAILRRDRAPWKRHIGSVLVVVLPQARGLGLGTLLVQTAIELAGELGLEKIVARMLVEDRDTVRVFEKLGFRHEGLLIDHAKASDGTLYDIAYMGLSLRKRREVVR